MVIAGIGSDGVEVERRSVEMLSGGKRDFRILVSLEGKQQRD